MQELTITHLDNYQTKKAMKNQLKRVNNLFNFDGQDTAVASEIYQIPFLNFKIFIKYYLVSLFSRKNIQLNISNPYPLIEKLTYIYKFKPDLNRKTRKKKPFPKIFSIHIRKGVSSKHITPGEKVTRVLPVDYYVKIIKSILEEIDKKDKLRVQIFTDAPEKSFLYRPLSFQKNHYKEFQKNKKGAVKIESDDFASIKEAFRTYELRVFRGGDPIKAFFQMMDSEILIMSKSSLSFVSALYCKGDVYYPPNFWHKPLNKWKKFIL